MQAEGDAHSSRDAAARRIRHVWILNHYAQQPGGPGGTRHYSLARHLPAFGWRASIIASGTEHGTGHQRLAPGEVRRLEKFDDVPFLWLAGNGYAGNGTDRVRNMVGYSRAALNRKNLEILDPPDAIIGSSVHPLAAWAGRRLARRYGVPFLFEVRDLWPQTLVDMGRLSPWSPMTIALRVLEKSLYRSAARIIVLLPRAGDYIEPLGISREKIVWISNGVELGDEAPPPDPATDKPEFALMYFGAHGQANGLDNLVRAMKIVADDPRGSNIRLRLIGDGPQKPALQALSRALGTSTISFEDPVPKSRIPEIAAAADAFVICVADLPNLYRFGISMNKIFDYMAAARPTIIAVGAVDNPIAESGGGIVTPPGSPAALAAAILTMAQLTPARRAAMGAAARAHVQAHYDFAHLAQRLALTLDETVAGQ